MSLTDVIADLVNRETRAWDEQDLETLLSVHHPDMVSLWPPTPQAHDPLQWVMGLGKFDRQRWGAAWGELFATHSLAHNRRVIRRIEIAKDGDAAFAVVDIDTLWRTRDGRDFHWQGRACKVYAKVAGRWLMVMQTGLLDYGPLIP